MWRGFLWVRAILKLKFEPIEFAGKSKCAKSKLVNEIMYRTMYWVPVTCKNAFCLSESPYFPHHHCEKMFVVAILRLICIILSPTTTRDLVSKMSRLKAWSVKSFLAKLRAETQFRKRTLQACEELLKEDERCILAPILLLVRLSRTKYCSLK